MDKEQTDLNSNENTPSPGEVQGGTPEPSLEQESLEPISTLEQPQSLEDPVSSTAVSEQQPAPDSDTNDSKPPLYAVSQASPSPAPSGSHSLFSNSGKYSFVGKSSHRKIAFIFLAVLTVLLIIAGVAASCNSRAKPA